MDEAVLPAPNHELIGTVKDLAGPHPDHGCGNHQLPEIVGIPECLVADLRHPLVDGQLRDGAQPEAAPGDPLQGGGHMDGSQTIAVAEDIVTHGGDAVGEHDLLEKITVTEGIILHLPDRFRDLFRRDLQ